MTCSRCGAEIESGSAFCRHCGAAFSAGDPPAAPRRLRRRMQGARLGGVCAGLAEYFDTDVSLVRLAWVVLSIFPGAFLGGLVAYLAAWIVMPEATGPAPAVTRGQLTRSTSDTKLAGVCGGLAAYFGIDSTLVRVAWVVLTIVPGTIVLGVIAYLVAWFIMPEPAAQSTTAVPSAAA